MKYLSVFSGCCGGDLGLEHLLGMEAMGYVEIDKYCCGLIRQRIADGVLSDAPVWEEDIREFNEKIAPAYRGYLDAVVGGPPCQDFSVAGHRAGVAGKRNLVPAFLDTVSILRPRTVLFENVPGITSIRALRNRLEPGELYIAQIIGAFAEIGYNARWCDLSASDVGANHPRKRFWMVLHAQNNAA